MGEALLAKLAKSKKAGTPFVDPSYTADSSALLWAGVEVPEPGDLPTAIVKDPTKVSEVTW